MHARSFVIWLALAGALLGLGASRGVRADPIDISIDPRQTFLRTDHDDTAPPPTAIDLQARGIQPGMRIQLRRLGHFLNSTLVQGATDTTGGMLALFSASDFVDPDHAQLTRVPGAIQTGLPSPDVGRTYVDNLSTDIPQDFAVPGDSGSVRVTVPIGGRYLYAIAADIRWYDNADPNHDYGIEITLLPPDVTGPTCHLTGMSASPVSLTITAQDTDSGLAAITPIVAENCQLDYALTPGTTAPVVITATKLNEALPARLALTVTDMSGNGTPFLPVIADLALPTRRHIAKRTLAGIPATEWFVVVRNGSPGMNRLQLKVNRTRPVRLAPAAGSTSTLDLRPQLMGAGVYQLRLTGHGPAGAHLLVVLGDHVTLSPSLLNHASAGSGSNEEWLP